MPTERCRALISIINVSADRRNSVFFNQKNKWFTVKLKASTLVMFCGILEQDTYTVRV